MLAVTLELNLFGACFARGRGDVSFEITGVKHRALLALLATAPFGVRSRAFLQETLWGAACYDTGRQSLRRALSDLRKIMSAAFDPLIKTRNSDVALDLTKVTFSGEPGRGVFLEGLEVHQRPFKEWVEIIRSNPNQLDSLFMGQAVQRPVPTVAVLPFEIAGEVGGMKPLGDWIASEISRTLSRSNLLAVISHLSSRQLARGAVDLQRVKTDLQAHYVATGACRMVGDTVIVDADLVDLTSGCIVWSRQFSGRKSHFVDLASTSIAEICHAIGRSIAEGSLAYVQDRPIGQVRNHNLLLGAVSLMHRPTLRNFTQSRKVLNELLQRRPNSPEAHAWSAKWHILSVFNKWSGNPASDTQKAVDCTARALDLNPDHAFALTIDGFAHNNLLRRLDIAEQRYESALEADPNSSFSWLLKGTLHAFKDEARQAMQATEKAVLLSPIDPFAYFYDTLRASACLASERYDEALTLANRSLSRNDRHLSTVRAKIAALHFLGRTEEAKQTAKELNRFEPDFTIDAYLSSHPAGGFELGKRVATALEAAGIAKGD